MTNPNNSTILLIIKYTNFSEVTDREGKGRELEGMEVVGREDQGRECNAMECK